MALHLLTCAEPTGKLEYEIFDSDTLLYGHNLLIDLPILRKLIFQKPDKYYGSPFEKRIMANS